MIPTHSSSTSIIKINQSITMKLKLILLAVTALPFWFNSCAPGEYHSVRVYDRHHHAAAPKDDPRAFVPKERF
jgi:hypothetical protein